MTRFRSTVPRAGPLPIQQQRGGGAPLRLPLQGREVRERLDLVAERLELEAQALAQPRDRSTRDRAAPPRRRARTRSSARGGRGLQRPVGELPQAAEEAVDLLRRGERRRREGARRAGSSSRLETAVTSGKPNVAPAPASEWARRWKVRRGSPVQPASRAAVAGRLDLGDADRGAGRRSSASARRRLDQGPQGCRERQIAWTVAARVMGSNGLAITSAAPICR